MSKQILVIAPSWIGDAVMTQPLVSILQDHQNKINKVDVLAPRWVEPIYKNMRAVRKTFTNPFLHGQLQICNRAKFAKKIKETKYDECYVLPNSFKSALIPFFAKIPVRIGYIGEARYPLLTNYKKLDKIKVHRMVDRYSQLAPITSSHPNEKTLIPKLDPQKQNVEEVKKKFLNPFNKTIICLCPGAEFGKSKMWPFEKYGDLANRLQKRGFLVIILGSKAEENLGDKILGISGNNTINLCGKTNLNEAISMISLSSVVVTNDSGLMHIAAALNRPTIAIFGSSSPVFTPPLSPNAIVASVDLKCSPCFKRICPLKHMHCMKLLSVDYIENLMTQLGNLESS